MLPDGWRDVSDVRQVPDHQEVWQDCMLVDSELQVDEVVDGSSEESNIALTNTTTSLLNDGDWLTKSSGTGGTFIIEIMDRQDSVPDTRAAQYFFEDLAEVNGCNIANGEAPILWEKIFHEFEILPNMSRNREEYMTCIACVGRQRVVIGKDKELQTAEGHLTGQLANKRLWVRTVMVVIRMVSLQTDLLITFTKEEEDDGENGQIIAEDLDSKDKVSIFLPVEPVVKLILETFAIEDWSLFV